MICLPFLQNTHYKCILEKYQSVTFEEYQNMATADSIFENISCVRGHMFNHQLSKLKIEIKDASILPNAKY